MPGAHLIWAARGVRVDEKLKVPPPCVSHRTPPRAVELNGVQEHRRKEEVRRVASRRIKPRQKHKSSSAGRASRFSPVADCVRLCAEAVPPAASDFLILSHEVIVDHEIRFSTSESIQI
jgi:hypothetical protein